MADAQMDPLSMSGDGADPTAVMTAIGKHALDSGLVTKTDAKKMQKQLAKPESKDFLASYLSGGKSQSPYVFGGPPAPEDDHPMSSPDDAPPASPLSMAPPASAPGVPQVKMPSPILGAGNMPNPAGIKIGTKGSIVKSDSKAEQTNTAKQTRNSYMDQGQIGDLAAQVRSLPEFQDQDKSTQALQDQLSMIKNMRGTNDGWVKPLLAFADSQNPGGKQLAGFDDANSTKRNDMLLKYQDEISKRKADMSKALLEGVSKMKNGSDQNDATNKLLENLALTQNNNTGGYANSRRNALIVTAGKDFDNQMKPYVTVDNSLGRAEEMLTGKVPLTARNFQLAAQDFINGVAPGGAATDAKTSREMPESFGQDVNKFLQKMGEIKDYRNTEEGKAQVKQLLDQVRSVRQGYHEKANQHLDEVQGTYGHIDDPDLKATVTDKRMLYNKRFPAPQASAAPALAPGDVKVVNDKGEAHIIHAGPTQAQDLAEAAGQGYKAVQ